MDWNTVLLWVCSASAFFTLFQLFTTPRAQWGWGGVSALVLIAGGVAHAKFPAWAGWIQFAVWGPFMIAPSLMHHVIRKADLSMQYKQAYHWSNVARFLHPLDGWWQNSQMFHALVLVDRGKSEKALSLFRHLQNRKDSVGLTARLYAHRLELDWAGVVELARAQPTPRSFLKSAQFLPQYLRALGELSRFDDMVDAYQQNMRATEAAVFTGLRAQARWMLFAYAGRTRSMSRLLDSYAKTLSPDRMKFWFARTEISAGRFEAVRPILVELTQSREHTTADAARRLLEAPPLPAVVGERQAAILDAAEADAVHEMRFSVMHPAHRAAPVATYAIIATNVIMYLVEMACGSTESDAGLSALGAAMSGGVSRGQWWRLISANFLHFGSAHIAMNMLALLAIGPMVERNLGRVRYLVIYMLCGIAAVGGAIIAMRLESPNHGDFLVGASGAIMGMIGAQLAILLWGWIKDRAHIAGRNLQMLLLIVAVQVVFDHMMPQVSGTAHLIGLGVGFILTLAVILIMPKRQRHFEM